MKAARAGSFATSKVSLLLLLLRVSATSSRSLADSSAGCRAQICCEEVVVDGTAAAPFAHCRETASLPGTSGGFSFGGLSLLCGNGLCCTGAISVGAAAGGGYIVSDEKVRGPLRFMLDVWLVACCRICLY